MRRQAVLRKTTSLDQRPRNLMELIYSGTPRENTLVLLLRSMVEKEMVSTVLRGDVPKSSKVPHRHRVACLEGMALQVEVWQGPFPIAW